jgi:hypothetical protein
MKIIQTTAIALALLVPLSANAAVDGTLGATSTGSFSVNMTLTPPPSTQVQVLGLDDIDLGSVPLTAGGQLSTVNNYTRPFCVNRNTPGTVGLKIDGGWVNNGSLWLTNAVAEANGFIGRVQLNVTLTKLDGSQVIIYKNLTVPGIVPTTSCTATTSAQGQAMFLNVGTASGNTYRPGDYSETFTMLVVPE